MTNFVHKKRGTVYTLDFFINSNGLMEEGDDLVFTEDGEIAYAKVQSSMGAYDGIFAIYYGSDGYFWARPAVEFFDGRFELI